MSTTYTFPVRFNGDPSAGAGLLPVFTLFKDAATGVTVSPSPTVVEIGGGHYKFAVDWDAIDNAIDTIVTIIDNTITITNPTERYITGSINRLDNFANTVVDTNTRIIALAADVTSILYIESGKWEIVNNQLLFYDTADNLIKTFNLFDEVGLPTSTSPFSRIPV